MIAYVFAVFLNAVVSMWLWEAGDKENVKRGLKRFYIGD